MATQTAVPKTYIAEWIKLDFFNNSNLKTDIQNRISDNIEQNFINALNEIRGDNKNSYGIPFSEIISPITDPEWQPFSSFERSAGSLFVSPCLYNIDAERTPILQSLE